MDKTRQFAVAVIALASASFAHAEADNAVLVVGWSSEASDEYFVGGRYGGTWASIDSAKVELIRDRLCVQAGNLALGSPIAGQILATLTPEQNARIGETLCEEETSSPPGFTIVYRSCAMYMTDGASELLFKASGGEAVMEMSSPEHERGMRMNLGRITEAVEPIKRMRGPAPTVTESGGTEMFSGYEASKHTFEYTANGSMLPGMPQGMGEMELTSEGTAWLADDVPGHDVVQSFYDSFAGALQSSGPGTQLMGGLTGQMAALIGHGFPMYVKTSTKARMVGGMVAPGLPMSLGRKSTSASKVLGVAEFPLDSAPEPVQNMCESSIFPPDAQPISF